jgi:hypothetical protein
MLAQIKALHTAIWAVMAFACLYVLYAGITGAMTLLVWVCVVLIAFEGLVLLVNKGVCPLTPMARKYTTEQRENFDIYLPEWLAKHNKMIFGVIFTAGLLLILLRLAL